MRSKILNPRPVAQYPKKITCKSLSFLLILRTELIKTSKELLIFIPNVTLFLSLPCPSLSFHLLLPISFSPLLSPSLPLHFSAFLNALVSFKSVSESIAFPGGKATFGSWLQEEVSAAAHNPFGLMSRQTSQQGGWGRESWSPRMEKAN